MARGSGFGALGMVGRGLRGEKNGGTATCRVVTVLDNIVEYSDRLAYHTYFTPYFQLPDSVGTT